MAGPSSLLDSRREYTRGVLIAIGLVCLVVVLALLLWAGADVFLLVFGGILFALFLRGTSDQVRRFLPLSPNWSLSLVITALAALLALGAWLLGSAVADQLSELVSAVEGALQKVREGLLQYQWGARLVNDLPGVTALTRSDSISRVTSLFSTSIGALMSVVVIGFTGIYLAFDPQLYRSGLLRLVPLGKRSRVGEVLDALGHTLRGWLVSQAFSMVVVGTATTLGLWMLGTPLPLGLGLIAFVFTFVPYIGPIAASVPALLVAFTVGPTHAVYVGLLYFCVQMVEGNVLTPLVQQRMVKLPPALTIVSQVLMGVLLGTPGVVFATPLAACAQVLVKKFYVEDVLGDREVPNDDREVVAESDRERMAG
jgi:predicted PurR-regulated permease PerM